MQFSSLLLLLVACPTAWHLRTIYLEKGTSSLSVSGSRPYKRRKRKKESTLETTGGDKESVADEGSEHCPVWLGKGFEGIAVVKRGSWVGQTNTISVFIKVLGLATKCRAFAHEVHRREEDAGARVALGGVSFSHGAQVIASLWVLDDSFRSIRLFVFASEEVLVCASLSHVS